MKDTKELYPLLQEPAKVVVTMHQKPDPDAMGSSLALANVLKAGGHSVTIISPTNWPDFLQWMDGTETVIDFESGPASKEKAILAVKESDWIFCLDFNVFDRTKHLAPHLASASARKILLDHHQQPDTASFEFGRSDVGKSSTCEMVYDFIQEAGWGDRINSAVSACLYAGIIGDTGSFRFAATTPSVHRMVADLKEKGLVHTPIHEALYDNFLENRLRFIGHILTNRMEIFYQYNTALICVSKADLLKYHIKTGDTEGIVNYPLSIKGIKFAGIVIDRDEERKWSFRSKGGFDVNTFARNHFQGGGHFNAAGGRSADSLEETAKKFRETIKQYEAELTK